MATLHQKGQWQYAHCYPHNASMSCTRVFVQKNDYFDKKGDGMQGANATSSFTKDNKISPLQCMTTIRALTKKRGVNVS